MDNTAVSKSFAASAARSGTNEGAIVKAWFFVGCACLIFMAYVVYRWVTAPGFGPTLLPPGMDMPTQYKIGIRTIEVVMPLVWLYFIYTQLVKPIRQSGQPNTLGLFGLAFFCAMFWDPAANFIQQGLVYNPYAFNMGFLSNHLPGWMSPRAELLPLPLVAWAGGYPGFLIWGCLVGMAAMRWTKIKFPTISNVNLAIAGVLATIVYDSIVEMLLIRVTGIVAYPGSIRSLSLFAGHWYQFPIYEGISFGGWYGLCAVLLYFKDDKGLTWIERGVEKIEMCKRSNFRTGMVRAIAVIGFCQIVELIVYAMPIALFTANADAFPDDTPAFFTTGTGMCGPGTGLACPSPDQPIIRRSDLEKFSNIPQISNERTMERVLDNSGRK